MTTTPTPIRLPGINADGSVSTQQFLGAGVANSEARTWSDPELERGLAEARSVLRNARRDLELAEAAAEQRFIAEHPEYGRNEAERKRTLLLAIQDDREYTTARDLCDRMAFELEHLEAEHRLRRIAREHDWIDALEALPACLQALVDMREAARG